MTCTTCGCTVTRTELETVLEEFSVTDEDHPMCMECAREHDDSMPVKIPRDFYAYEDACDRRDYRERKDA